MTNNKPATSPPLREAVDAWRAMEDLIAEGYHDFRFDYDSYIDTAMLDIGGHGTIKIKSAQPAALVIEAKARTNAPDIPGRDVASSPPTEPYVEAGMSDDLRRRVYKNACDEADAIIAKLRLWRPDPAQHYFATVVRALNNERARLAPAAESTTE